MPKIEGTHNFFVEHVHSQTKTLNIRLKTFKKKKLFVFKIYTTFNYHSILTEGNNYCLPTTAKASDLKF